MNCRTLGQTGVRVSTLSFGGSSLGSVFRPVPEDEGIAAVHAALDAGVNLFDTSPFYGLTRAETVLGKALRGIPRERYLLSTKCGRYGSERGDFDFSAQRVTRSIDESLSRLGVEHVDLLFAHDIEFGDVQQVIHETIPALQRIQQAGKARFIGISAYPLRLFTDVLDGVGPGVLQVVLSYCHYALNDTSLLSILDTLEQRGVGVVNASPTAMGLLTQHPVPDWHPAPPQLRAACRSVVEHCRERGVDAAELAVQFSVSHPRVPTTLVGTGDPDEMRRNIAAVQRPMDAQLVAEVQAILAPVRDMTWPSGRPENN